MTQETIDGQVVEILSERRRAEQPRRADSRFGRDRRMSTAGALALSDTIFEFDEHAMPERVTLRLVEPLVETQEVVITPHTYEYRYPKQKLNFRVEVVDGRDSRIGAAIEMEIDAMHELGDPKEEVRAEFEPYRKSSLYFLAFDMDSSGEAEELVGMGRIIPGHGTEGSKSLSDLAIIKDWGALAFPRNWDGPLISHDPATVIAAFKAESGCQDLDKLWDIATMAPKLGLDNLKNALVADAVIASFTQETMQAYRRGELTHMTSFNEEHAHHHFLHLGYPFLELFGLPPMLYDSFDSGEGMKAQIGWVSAEKLAATILAKQTRHMGFVALQPAMRILDGPIRQDV